jgi:hypothetical protein
LWSSNVCLKKSRLHLPPNNLPYYQFFIETSAIIWRQHQWSKMPMATPSATMLSRIVPIYCRYKISMFWLCSKSSSGRLPSHHFPPVLQEHTKILCILTQPVLVATPRLHLKSRASKRNGLSKCNAKWRELDFTHLLSSQTLKCPL